MLPTHLPPPSCTHAQSCNPMDCSPPGSSVHGSSVLLPLSRQEYWSGLPFPFPHVVIYHVQSFSDGHFSPQVSYSMILFIPWNYEGKKKKESTRENQRPFKYFHHESTSCRGNISPKCNLLNFHKSFPFKMSHWSDSEIKLEALSVYLILSSSARCWNRFLQAFILYVAELSSLLSRGLLLSGLCHAGACFRALVAVVLPPWSIWAMLDLNYLTVALSSWSKKGLMARTVIPFNVQLFV